MMVLSESKTFDDRGSSQPRARMRLLTQMAEALEDQAAGLYRRAAAAEEEEFLLNREIEERQTEINRLVLKLDAMRAERDRVLERIETISQEATTMREEVFNGEEEVALAAIESSAASSSKTPAGCAGEARINGDSTRATTFFRRLTLSEQPTMS